MALARKHPVQGREQVQQQVLQQVKRRVHRRLELMSQGRLALPCWQQSQACWQGLCCDRALRLAHEHEGAVGACECARCLEGLQGVLCLEQCHPRLHPKHHPTRLQLLLAMIRCLLPVLGWLRHQQQPWLQTSPALLWRTHAACQPCMCRLK